MTRPAAVRGTRAERPLPCPFCARKPKVEKNTAVPYTWVVICPGNYADRKPCGGSPMTDSFKTRAEAVAVWNYRPAPKEKR